MGPSEDKKALPIYAWLLKRHGAVCNGYAHERDCAYYIEGTSTVDGVTMLNMRFKDIQDAIECKLMWHNAS